MKKILSVASICVLLVAYFTATKQGLGLYGREWEEVTATTKAFIYTGGFVLAAFVIRDGLRGRTKSKDDTDKRDVE